MNKLTLIVVLAGVLAAVVVGWKLVSLGPKPSPSPTPVAVPVDADTTQMMRLLNSIVDDEGESELRQLEEAASAL